MKPFLNTLFIFIGFLCINLDLSGQQSVDRFISQMKKTESYYGVSVPAWLVRWSSKWIVADDKPEYEEIQTLLSHVRHLRVATSHLNKDQFDIEAIVSNFIKKAEKTDGFETLVGVKERAELVNVLVKEEDEELKNVVIVQHDAENVTIVHLKTDLPMEELQNMRFGFMDWDN